MNAAAETLLQLCSLVVCYPTQSFFVPTVHVFFLPIPALLQLAALLTHGGQGAGCLQAFALLF